MNTDPHPQFEALLDHLKRSRGFDFKGYKRSSLVRRVNRRMSSIGMESYLDYIDFLEVHPEEFLFLFNTILINVTSFFRDTEAWIFLNSEIIPRILRSNDGDIRIWSAGCASGEETYTIAILLCEALGIEQFHERVKIYATDIDEEALAQARAATYPNDNLGAIPGEWRSKYFVQNGNCSVFRPELRRSVIFGRHDVVQDAPISRLDLLICRNMLMYLNAETQARILARFHFALRTADFCFWERQKCFLAILPCLML